MRVAIIGCGAMGSLYAALLAAAGNDVLAIDRSVEHVSAIERDGLQVEGASGERTVRLNASTKPPDEVVDLVVIATKAMHVEKAVADARPLLGPKTLVLTIQNGLGSAETVAGTVGEERVIVGVAGGFGASRPTPGLVRHSGMGTLYLGSYTPQHRSRLGEVTGIWSDAGFHVTEVADIVATQWEKLICNVAYSAPCALTGYTVGEAMDDPHVREISHAAAREAWSAARALRVPINVPDPIAHVLAFGEQVRDAKPSVLLDHERRRPSEIDVINGAVPREAAKAGEDAPVNRTLTLLVKQREHGFPTVRRT